MGGHGLGLCISELPYHVPKFRICIHHMLSTCTCHIHNPRMITSKSVTVHQQILTCYLYLVKCVLSFIRK